MFRRWWRRIRSELRYLTERQLVWYVLRRRPNRRFVRIVIDSNSGMEVPVLAPVSSGEGVTTGLIRAMQDNRAYFKDTTVLIPLERRLDALFAETNFVDLCVKFQGGMFSARLLRQPRLTKPPLPRLPDWTNPDHKWDVIDPL